MRLLLPIARRSAVTLVELLVVVLIMSILAAAATPTYLDSLVFHRVESAARRLKADFELVRHTARLTSATQTIAFKDLSYTIAGTSSLDAPSSLYAVNFAAAPYELDQVKLDFANLNSVSFDGYGKPSRGGTIVLTAKGHQRVVALDSTTGEVTITSSQVTGE